MLDVFFENKKVWVTGHKGMLGSAMVRSMHGEGANLLLTSRDDLDLCDQSAVFAWVERNRPELIFHIGAKVGGINANATKPAEFLYSNLMIQTNVIEAAQRVGCKKLIFVASNCTYPVAASQPIVEDSQLTGSLEPNIRSYAVSKIAGIEMCRAYRKQYSSDFVAVIPPNLYGPKDNYHPEHSHVVAGILRRMHEAKVQGKLEVSVWGDGTPRRELLHVDDLASAMKLIMRSDHGCDLFNIGSGNDHSIAELAAMIAKVVGFEGQIAYDASKPNGSMGKLLDSTRVFNLGWRPKVDVFDGLASAYQDLLGLLQNPSLESRV